MSDNGLAILADLERGGSLTAAGLKLTVQMPYEQYESLLLFLSSVHRRSAWALGDALLYGERLYGETYAQAASLTGFSEQYLQNLTSICRRVPRERRHPELSMGHHDVVARMEPQDQTRWLEQAVAERWTRQDLRAKVDEEAGRELPRAGDRCRCCGRDL